jgi:peptidoglycan/xylan/chitin deacetylase (PgdA/CDA1 family)
VPVAITFDDDWKSHLDVSAPILKRFGLPATFFLCGASLHRPFTFWWELLQRAVDRELPGLGELAGLATASGRPSIHTLGEAFERMAPKERDAASERLRVMLGGDPEEGGLSRDEVARLASEGFEIGFHTLRHDRLPDLPDAALGEAMVRGRDSIVEAAGKLVQVIAYPHGRADQRVGAAACAAGFLHGFTTTEEPIASRSDPFLLSRRVPSSQSVRHLASQLSKTLLRGLMPR